MQAAIIQAKRENPRRSINQIRRLLEHSGQVARGELSRSSIHRLLKSHGLSRMSGSSSEPQERRAYVAAHAGDIWYGDVMHGPRVPVAKRLRKVYLVSLMDDASRLIAHSAFRPGETALDIEGVLKQAVLKRGRPSRMVLDNGAAYRAKTLQGICARLGIHLIYCRPYQPEAKDYASHCTSFVVFGATSGKRRRCESFRPWLLTGGSSPGYSYRHSFLSLYA